MTFRSGRHFLQLPGPTNVPDRVLRAMDRPVIDHRGPDFALLGREVLDGLERVFRTSHPVLVYPSSATGAWEAALSNTLSPGDRVLLFDRGFFAQKWAVVAERLGLDVDLVPGDWRTGVTAEELAEKLRGDPDGSYRAVLIVHNETATGVTVDVPGIRRAMDEAGHPALLMLDAVSSLCATDLRHEEWRVDVTVSGSQKGFMLPPGLSFNAISPKALEAYNSAALPRSYWDWNDMLRFNESGYFPYTPATNLLYGLAEAIRMLEEEGLVEVFARHARHAAATRLAVATWGLENLATDPAQFSNAATSVMVPDGHDADELRRVILDRFDMSLGTGLGKLAGGVFRIGHLGHFNDLTLAGTLSGVEMGLSVAGVPHAPGGVQAALDFLAG